MESVVSPRKITAVNRRIEKIKEQIRTAAGGWTKGLCIRLDRREGMIMTKKGNVVKPPRTFALYGGVELSVLGCTEESTSKERPQGKRKKVKTCQMAGS